MPGPSKQSRFMQRCVADVTGQGKALGSAFAICTAQSQKAGYSEPGSRKQTGKGKAREKQFKKESDMGTKAKAYERAVQRGRKGRAEDMAGVFAALEETAPGRRSYQELEDKQLDGVSAAARKALRTMDATIAAMKGLAEWWSSTHQMLRTMDDAAASLWRGETEKCLARAADAQDKAKELRAIVQHLDPYYGGMR